MLRVFICGAHSVGKTTLVDEVGKELPNIHKQAEVARKVIKDLNLRREDFDPRINPAKFEELQIKIAVAIWPVTGQGFQNTKWPAVPYSQKISQIEKIQPFWTIMIHIVILIVILIKPAGFVGFLYMYYGMFVTIFYPKHGVTGDVWRHNILTFHAASLENRREKSPRAR